MPLYTPPFKAAILPYTGPSDSYQPASNFVAQVTGTPVSGTVYFEPYDVSSAGQIIKGLAVNCTTAAAGGTLTYTLAIYGDSGTGGTPLTVGGPLGSVVITAAATGTRYTAFATPITLQPGRYWLAFLYVATTAPSTAGVFTCLQQSLNLWHVSSVPPGTVVKAHTVAGQTAMPTGAVTLAAHGGTSAPVMAARLN